MQTIVDFYLTVLKQHKLTPKELSRYQKRILQSKLTREENPLSHTCAMILPFDPSQKKVLLIHHKKANSWLFPGGHVDQGEMPFDTAVREASEELGLLPQNIQLLGPFGAQILDIDNPPQICREHYDLFYAIPVQPSEVDINMREFYGYEWLSIEEASEKIALQYYRDALDKFVNFISFPLLTSM